MSLIWGHCWRTSRNALTKGWLITAAITALYMGVIQPVESSRGIAESKATGLAAVASPWDSQMFLPLGSSGFQPMLQRATEDQDELRMVVRTELMELAVRDPAAAQGEIGCLVEHLGGYRVSSQVNQWQGNPHASVVLRIPAEKSEEARTQIKRLALQVESEEEETKDVTKEHIDREARLHNLQVEEQQYFRLMKRATRLEDILAVTEKLNEVRGQIESDQAEFAVLSKQVETVLLTVTLRVEGESKVFGLHWQPLSELKFAARAGLDGMANYLAAMMRLVFFLPSAFLWLLTFLVGASVGWKILRWAARLLFGWTPATATPR